MTSLRRAGMWIARNRRFATLLALIVILSGVAGVAINDSFQQAEQTTAAEDRLELDRLIGAGDWEGVLDWVGNLPLEVRSEVFMQLTEYQANDALGRTKTAYEILDRLLKRDDLSKRTADVYALDASRLLLKGKSSAARDLAKLIETTDQDSVAANFATALTTVHPGDAIRGLEAVWGQRRHPLHLDAGRLLLSSYIVAGRRDEAAIVAEVMKTLYVKDSAPYFCQAWIAFIENDVEQGVAILKSAPAGLNEKELAQHVRTYEGWRQLNLAVENWMQPVSNFQMLRLLAQSITIELDEADSATVAFLPCFETVYTKVILALGKWAIPFSLGRSSAISTMRDLTDSYSEGSLLMTLGAMHFIQSDKATGDEKVRQWRLAANAFERALEAPAVVPEVHWQSRYMSGVCNTVVFAVTGDVEAKATATKRLREYRREKPTFPRLTRYVLVSGIPLLGDSGLVDSIVLDSIDDPKLVSQLVEKAKEISVRTPKIAKRILRNILNADLNHKAAKSLLKQIEETSGSE